MPKVNPKILVWARETAGLTQDEAARKLGFRDTQRASALDKLAGLEEGKAEPTRPQLVKMAAQYRRPLLTFYLPAPPAKGDRGADFRTLPTEHSESDDAVLDALVRDVRARQSIVRAVLDDMEEAETLDFVGSRRMDDGPAAVLASLRALIDVDLADYRRPPNATAAFNLLRAEAERAGVFVLLMGNLGTYHTDVDTDTFRGFTIADDIAPFVIINHHDSSAARSFTLLHELTHLILGHTGISAGSVENAAERFCNDVASGFLLSQAESMALRFSDTTDFEEMFERISQFSSDKRISWTMTAYRDWRVGGIDWETFNRSRHTFRRQWSVERERTRALTSDQEGWPGFYVVRRHKLGTSLVNLTRRAIHSGELTTSKAAKVLGVKPGQVGLLLDTVQGRRGI